MNKIIIIYGPTAIGKSDIGVKLAKQIDAEIISADSMQIYKDLNVGSAKITNEEMQGIKHHLIDIRNCDEEYSVFEFVCDCKKCIDEITSRNKNVVIVGGTGLYIKALTENYNYANTNKNEKLREELNNLSNEELQEILLSKNVKLTESDKNNRHRLIRYIEINSQNQVMSKSEFDDRYLIFGLNMDRQKLYDRINRRVDMMKDLGIVEETKYLLSKVNENSQSLKAIGYKELLPYINGTDTLENCLMLLKQKTRNYAKRQITFMNQFHNIIKIDAENKDDAVKEIIKNIKKFEC